MRRQRVRLRLVVVRLLDHAAARFVHRDLPRDLRVDPARDERERVHVLELAARAITGLSSLAHGDVRVDAQRPLFHLGVGDAELDDRLAQQLQEAARFVGRADVRLRHDLHKGRSAAVEVDE